MDNFGEVPSAFLTNFFCVTQKTKMIIKSKPGKYQTIQNVFEHIPNNSEQMPKITELAIEFSAFDRSLFDNELLNKISFSNIKKLEISLSLSPIPDDAIIQFLFGKFPNLRHLKLNLKSNNPSTIKLGNIPFNLEYLDIESTQSDLNVQFNGYFNPNIQIQLKAKYVLYISKTHSQLIQFNYLKLDYNEISCGVLKFEISNLSICAEDLLKLSNCSIEKVFLDSVNNDELQKKKLHHSLNIKELYILNGRPKLKPKLLSFWEEVISRKITVYFCVTTFKLEEFDNIRLLPLFLDREFVNMSFGFFLKETTANELTNTDNIEHFRRQIQYVPFTCERIFPFMASKSKLLDQKTFLSNFVSPAEFIDITVEHTTIFNGKYENYHISVSESSKKVEKNANPFLERRPLSSYDFEINDGSISNDLFEYIHPLTVDNQSWVSDLLKIFDFNTRTDNGPVKIPDPHLNLFEAVFYHLLMEWGFINKMTSFHQDFQKNPQLRFDDYFNYCRKETDRTLWYLPYYIQFGQHLYHPKLYFILSTLHAEAPIPTPGQLANLADYYLSFPKKQEKPTSNPDFNLWKEMISNKSLCTKRDISDFDIDPPSKILKQ